MIPAVLTIVFAGLIGGLIGGLVLMLATRIVLKQACEFGPAFQVAVISTIVGALVKTVLANFVGSGGLGGLLGLAAGFGVMAFVTDQQLGVGLGRAAIVTAVVYVIYIVVGVLLLLMLFSAAPVPVPAR